MLATRRPGRVVAIVAALLAGLGALPACRSHSKGGGGGGTAVAEVEPKNPRPVAYRILYHVEQPGAASNAERWEELTVRRPFEARSAVFTQRPPAGATPNSGTLATIDHLYQFQDAGLQEIAGRQPGPPTGDQALGVELIEADRRQQAAATGTTRTVAGRTCRDRMFLDPPAGAMGLLKGKDHDLLCIDDDGLVLREEWTLAGKVVLRRQAETVDLAPAPADLDRVLSPAAAKPLPETLAAPRVQPSTADNPVMAEPPAPAGFTKTAVTDFLLPGQQSVPGAPAPILYTSTVFAYARGGDCLTVEVGVSTGPMPWKDTDVARDVDLPFGKAQSVLRSDGPELRADLGQGRFIRVRGTISPEALEAYARTLPAPR